MTRILILVLVLQFNFGFGQEKFRVSAVKQFQRGINAEYSDPKISPLTAEDLQSFKTLEFYPINDDYFVVAKFVRSVKQKPFAMETSTDRKPMYLKYGEVHFLLDGKELKLNVYRNIELSKTKEFKDYLFLPFSDLTSGKESYIGGKYMDLKIPDGNTMVLDFNTSYNPYCAYNPKYSCPKVPLENDLNVEILAGVKKFHD